MRTSCLHYECMLLFTLFFIYGLLNCHLMLKFSNEELMRKCSGEKKVKFDFIELIIYLEEIQFNFEV